MCAAAAGLCGLGVMSAAIASPSFSRERSLLSTFVSGRSPPISHSLAPKEPTSTLQLDLRPPGASFPASIFSGASSPAFAAFPSSMHRFDLPKLDHGESDRIAQPTLGTGEASFRVMSPAETIARRIHREGLPIVRLWQSNSALLSIGLNQRGKPGLWFTQKIP